MSGEGFGDRADAEKRVAVRRSVAAVGAAAEPLDRGLAVADDADDERGNFQGEKEHLAGEADRLVELSLPGSGEKRPGQGRAGEKGEGVASAHNDDPYAPLRLLCRYWSAITAATMTPPLMISW